MFYNNVYEFDLTDLSTYSSSWKSISVPINQEILTDKTVFIILGDVINENKFQYLYYSIDSLVITGTIALEPPSNVTVTRNPTSTTLTWDTVTDATQYIVYRSDKPDTGFQEIGSTVTTVYDDTETIEDGVYFYKIVSESIQKILKKTPNPTNFKEVK